MTTYRDMGDVVEALRNAKRRNTITSRMHLDRDTDLDNVRDADWFREF